MKQHWHNFKQVRKSRMHSDSLKQQCVENGKHLPLAFNIVVWNIFKRHGSMHFDSDLLELSDKTHIFCLQEVLHDQALFLPDEFKQMNYNYAISYLRHDEFCEGVLTLSEYTQLEESHGVLSIGREPVTKTPKASVITMFPLEDGRNLLVINIHMLLFKTNRSMLRELEQILEITHEYSDWPAIFAGDFNTFTARQREVLDRRLAAEGYSRCFPKHEPRMGRFLDHIYVRGMRRTDVRILDYVKTSDHYPLYCSLVIDDA